MSLAFEVDAAGGGTKSGSPPKKSSSSLSAPALAYTLLATGTPTYVSKLNTDGQLIDTEYQQRHD